MKIQYFVPVVAVLAASPAMAQSASNKGDYTVTDSTVRDDTITVVATGTRLPLNQTGQSISVIGANEIASIQGPDITRVLARLPGVTVARSGPIGSTTSLFVRGGNSEQVLVLVDGVRVEDVAAPSGGYDFGGLLSGGIGKVELLRGSNSVVWGSDAMAGVLAITSREINGVEAGVEYGNHQAVDGNISAGIMHDGYALSVNGGYASTRGISAAAIGTEADGFHQWHLSARGRLALSDGLDLVATGRYANSKVDIDGFPAPLYSFADTPEFQKSKQASGRIGLVYKSNTLTLNGGVALSDMRRAYFDPTFGTAPNYTTNGRSTRADLTGNVQLPSDLALDFGADSEWTKVGADKANLTSGHALLGYYGDRLVVAGGARVDSHSRFGSHWTFGANGSFRIVDDLRIRASYGEGFKAPTLYQLYDGFYGNARLTPESSRSYEVGLEKGERNGSLHAAITLFHRDITNLISFSFPVGYINLGKVRAEGFELEGDARPTKNLSIHVAYSYVKSINQTVGNASFGKDLARRPRHALTMAADWETPLAGLKLGADVRLAGGSFDNASNTVRLKSYVLAGLRASVPVTKQLELYGRIENLSNESYQTVAGYGSEGRGATIGVKARF